MGRKTVFVLLLASGALGGACASIAGLDAFKKGQCSGGECDSGLLDSTVDAADEADVIEPGDDATVDATGDVVEAGPDRVTFVDAGEDADGRVEDARDERETGKDAGDAGVDCGPTDTTKNCAACGQACADDKAGNATASTCNGTTCAYTCAADFADCNASTPPDTDGCETSLKSTSSCSACGVMCSGTNAKSDSCSGLTCSYTCLPGFVDCNAATAPDTDGCECAGTACCGTGCQTAHTNGEGQTFYDCNPVGTYTFPEAFEACHAYQVSVGAKGGCGLFGCDVTDAGALPPYTECSLNAAKDKCVGHCWGYTDGGLAGNVYSCLCNGHGGEPPPESTWQ